MKKPSNENMLNSPEEILRQVEGEDQELKTQTSFEDNKPANLFNILAHSNNIFYEHDCNGHFTFISPHIKNVLGYSPEEMDEKWQESLTDNPINQIGIKATELAISTGKTQPPYELELFAKNGNKIWLEMREVPVIEDGKTVSIAGVSQDITEKKLYQQKLQKSEENYRLIVENQSELIIKFDLEGTILFASSNYFKTFGVNSSQVIGNKFIPKIHPEDKPKIQKILDNSLIPPYDCAHTERMETKNGWRWFSWRNKGIINSEGNVEEIISVGRDINERIENHKEIQKLALIAKETDNAVIIIDENKNLEWINEGFTRITGYELHEVIGRNIGDFLQGQKTNPDTILKIKNALNSGEQIRTVILNYRKNGESYWNDINIKPIKDENGNTNKFISIQSDITERKLAEEELKKSEETATALLNSFNESAFLLDANGHVVALNETSAKNCSKTKKELIGRNIFDLMPDEVARDRLTKLSEINKKKSTIRFEDEINNKYFYNIISPIFNDDGSIFRYAVFASDVTEKKKAEVALKISEEKFSKAFSNNPNAITLSSLEDGKILEINDYGAKALGYSRNELIGKTSLELGIVTKNDREIIFDELKKNGSYSGLELTVITKSNEKKIGLFYGQPISIGGQNYLFQTITDITDIRKAEIALKEQHNLMRTMIDELPFNIFVKDKDHKFVLANKALAKLHNFDSPDDLIGKTDYDLFPRKLADRYKTSEKKFMDSNKGISDKVDVITDENGNKEWWNNTKIPFYNLEGSSIGLVGIHKNITEIIKAEKALQEIEERYRTIFESSSSGILIFDSNFNILEANPAACKMYGYSTHEIKKLNLRDITTQYTFEKHAHKVMKCLDEGIGFEFEAIDLKKDGTEFWTNVYLNPLYSLGENYTLDIVIDITERKLAEKALKDSEERYRTIFNATSNSFVIFDVDLKIIDANPAACEMYMYSINEIKSLSIRDIKTPKMIEDHLPTLHQLLEENKWREFESTDIKKNGEKFWTDVRLHRFKFNDKDYFLEIANDITARKKAEIDLRASEEKFSKAFYLSPDSITISSIENGTLLDVNKGFEQMFGYSREETIGKSTLDLKLYSNPKDRKKVLEQIKKNGFVKNFLAKYGGKNNKIGVGEISAQLISISDENYLLTIVRDITERKRAEEEIQEYQKNLKSLTSEITLAEEKERRRIAVNLHDHLGQSLAMTKIKISEANKEQDILEMTSKIDAAKKYIDDSIKNSRSITYELSPPVLYELGLKAAVRWRLDQIKEEHDINTEFIGNLDTLILDDNIKILLFRAIMEVLNNGIKHSKAKKISVDIGLTNKILKTVVIDDGIGFDPITAEKEATKKKSFGLFTIRERISYLNGDMNINSTIGKGTEIIIEIPI